MRSTKIKKPAIYIITAVLIAGIFLTAFIVANDRFKRQADKSPYDIDLLLENKTQFIGNNSKVGALINAMPLPEGVFRDKFELHTDMAPYGLTIYYHLNDDSLRISEEQFLRNSVLLFALVDNLGKVEHIGFWNNKALSSIPICFSYTRADAERIVGGDVRQFAENIDTLTELTKSIQLLREDVGESIGEDLQADEEPQVDEILSIEYPANWPKLQILYGDKHLVWVRGDSNFTGEPGGVIGNTMFGMNEEHVGKMVSNTVKPGAGLTFIADEVAGLNKPLFELQILNPDNTVSSYPTQQDTMILPEKAGEYIFILSVDWGNGDNNILYWFKVLAID